MVNKKQVKGNYIEAHDEVLSLIRELSDIVTPISKDRKTAIRSLLMTLNKPLFSVAVTGPSRVGKSTLINALLRSDVSPIDLLPTTGIPSTYEPANKDKIKIILKNGKIHEYPLELGIMQEWVSQQENPDNKKNVRQVIVQLESNFLKLGFSILDLPGLDDPSDNIRNMAEIALESADAIIYVMGASGYADGSFLFTKNNKEELQRLVGRKDKTFVVLNKSDKLTSGQKSDLKNYLLREFKRFELIPLNNDNMFFLSAKNAFEKRCLDSKDKNDADFTAFEIKLWDYLLRNNEIGRNRLIGVLFEASNLVSDQVSISSLALDRTQKALDLKKYLVRFNEIPNDVHSISVEGYSTTLKKAEGRLHTDCDRAIRRLSSSLRNIPVFQPLPSRKKVKLTLEQAITKMSKDSRQEAEISFREWSTKANKLVQNEMTSLKSEINEYLAINMPSGYAVGVGEPIQGNPLTPFGGAIGLALAGAMFGPLGAVIGGIVGFLLGLFVDETKRREREIEDILGKSAKILYSTEEKIMNQMDRVVGNAFQELESGLNIRIEAASKTLRLELENLGEPLPEKRKIVIEKAISNLHDLEPQIKMVMNKLI